MAVVKRTNKEQITQQQGDAGRFERYAKSPYFIEKNKRAEELIKKSPAPDWMRK